jgi:hypothetical protein
MTTSEQERIAAKVEELDKLIAELQKRRHELLRTKEAGVEAASTRKEEAAEAKVPVKIERPHRLEARAPPNALEATLDSLPWKSFKKKEGEWAFLRDREGRLIDELQSAKEFVDRVRKEGEVVVGKHRYVVSEDKFLNRYYEAPNAA